jgi:DNA polymerase elongation subunit (family B)
MHNFKLVNADTDSITICKPDGSLFSDHEQESLLRELNSLFPKTISWEDDGYYRKVIVLKIKNYITQTQDGKVKIKGSALKASTKSPAMKEMINRIIDSMLNDRNDFQDIYLEYIKEAAKVKDIKRWASRKTISERTLNSERKNETRIKDVIQGTEIVEGDRIYVFNKTKDELELVERFNGVYDIDKMLQSVYDTAWVFENVLDCESLFPNYKLKKMKPKLQELINEDGNCSTNGHYNEPRKTSSSGSSCSSIGCN